MSSAPLPPWPVLSADESQQYGLRFVRTSAVISAHNRLALWDNLCTQQADVCRLSTPADQAHELFSHLQALGLPHSLFGVLLRVSMTINFDFPANLPPPKAHYRPSTPQDYDQLYHVALQVAPDVLPFQFADPLADALLPPAQRTEALARHIASFATAPAHERRCALLMELDGQIVGYTTLRFLDNKVESAFGGVLPQYRSLGLMRDMNPYQTQYIRAQGPQYQYHWYDTHIQNKAMTVAALHYGMKPQYDTVINLNLMPLWNRSIVPPLQGPWHHTQPLAELWATLCPKALAEAQIPPHWAEQQRQHYIARCHTAPEQGHYRLSWPVRTDNLAVALLATFTATGQPAATLYLRFMPPPLA